MHIPSIFNDLALILMVAVVTTMIFKWLKQPVVLGYIVAGIITGPHFLDFITVDSTDNIKLWGEFGVVFLLFALGLEFNLKKLHKVGGTGAITVLSELIIMFSVGFLAGHFMGWKVMDCIFLGSMITISSTTIVIKAFDELGLRKHKFSNVVFGVLIVEDVVAVLQLVVLSTIVIGAGFSGEQLMSTFSTLLMFIVFFFVLGIYIIPGFLKMTRKIISEENLLLIATGLCFGMVVLTDKFGYSSALGAFLMGVILAETLESEKIHHLISPLKHLFVAVFFVSVGMLVDFSVIASNIFPILIITMLVLFVKPLSAMLGIFTSGQPLKTAVQSGLSLGQIGEFSFIIATLGLNAGVIDPMLYPIIVSVSVITTFITPYSTKIAEPLYERIHKVLPIRWQKIVERPQKAPKPQSSYKIFIKKSSIKYIFSTLIYVSLLSFIVFLSIYALKPFVEQFLPLSWAKIISFTVTLVAILPVLWVLIAERLSFRDNFHRIWRKNTIDKIILLSLILIRVLILTSFIAFLVVYYFHFTMIIAIVVALILTLFIILSQKRINNYFKIEEKFLQNMNQKPTIPELSIPEDLSKNLRTEVLTVSDCSEVIGKTLAELHCCEQYGVNVISIIHGFSRFDLPSGEDHLFPNDKLVVIGNEEQLNAFKSIIEKEGDFPLKKTKMNLYHISLSPHSSLIGKTKEEIGFRKNHNCMLVCISRKKKNLMNPTSSTVLRSGDLLWLIGEKETILNLEHL
ncbi:MAG: cation:proton antiporter [Lentimicrobiaceae bacterium]|nr:cation:proton antiporter [Lentimicrobiaceae bacterium]